MEFIGQVFAKTVEAFKVSINLFGFGIIAYVLTVRRSGVPAVRRWSPSA